MAMVMLQKSPRVSMMVHVLLRLLSGTATTTPLSVPCVAALAPPRPSPRPSPCPPSRAEKEGGHRGAFTPPERRRRASRDPAHADDLDPTAGDLKLEGWYRRSGILDGTTDSRVGVRTTPRSVGGRGLFWLPSAAAGRRGDVLARVPRRCVLSSRTMPSVSSPPGTEWPVWLTVCALSALLGDEGGNRDDDVGDDVDLSPSWSEWIQTWSAGGDDAPSFAPRDPATYSEDELSALASAADSTADLAPGAVEARYDTFLRHREAIADILRTTTVGTHDIDADARHDVGELYGLVLSRAANLGPTWGRDRGIVPLHDMLNHPPPSAEPNVELIAWGDARRIMPPASGGRSESESPLSELEKAAERGGWREEDLLLVAREAVQPGEELLLSYVGRKSAYNPGEKERLWKLLQYGFPLS